MASFTFAPILVPLRSTCLVIKALFDKYYNESPLRIEIRRPPKEDKDDDE